MWAQGSVSHAVSGQQPGGPACCFLPAETFGELPRVCPSKRRKCSLSGMSLPSQWTWDDMNLTRPHWGVGQSGEHLPQHPVPPTVPSSRDLPLASPTPTRTSVTDWPQRVTPCSPGPGTKQPWQRALSEGVRLETPHATPGLSRPRERDPPGHWGRGTHGAPPGDSLFHRETGTAGDPRAQPSGLPGRGLAPHQASLLGTCFLTHPLGRVLLTPRPGSSSTS